MFVKNTGVDIDAKCFIAHSARFRFGRAKARAANGQIAFKGRRR
jgi:hypothetical protein